MTRYDIDKTGAVTPQDNGDWVQAGDADAEIAQAERECDRARFLAASAILADDSTTLSDIRLTAQQWLASRDTALARAKELEGALMLARTWMDSAKVHCGLTLRERYDEIRPKIETALVGR